MKFELDVLMAELNKKEAQEQNKRLRVEVEAMVKALQRSEADKLTLVDTLNKMTRDAIFAKNETAAMRARLDQVEQQLRDTQKRLNEAGGKKGAVDFGPRAGNDANPPAVKVKGSITKIAEDKNDGAGVLAEISVGADHGVNVNHTLEVYRAAPKPDYVGRLRILSVTEKTSIGRLISPGGAQTCSRLGMLLSNGSIRHWQSRLSLRERTFCRGAKVDFPPLRITTPPRNEGRPGQGSRDSGRG